MREGWKEAARLIDISAVRTHHTEEDVRETVRIAKQYGFINVHSLPCFTKLVSTLLKDEPDIYTGAPVGFPSGGHRTELKVEEARNAFLEASRERKVLDKLKEKRQKEYRKEMLGEEAKVLDDISGGASARTALQ